MKINYNDLSDAFTKVVGDHKDTFCYQHLKLETKQDTLKVSVEEQNQGTQLSDITKVIQECLQDSKNIRMANLRKIEQGYAHCIRDKRIELAPPGLLSGMVLIASDFFKIKPEVKQLEEAQTVHQQLSDKIAELLTQKQNQRFDVKVNQYYQLIGEILHTEDTRQKECVKEEILDYQKQLVYNCFPFEEVKTITFAELNQPYTLDLGDEKITIPKGAALLLKLRSNDLKHLLGSVASELDQKERQEVILDLLSYFYTHTFDDSSYTAEHWRFAYRTAAALGMKGAIKEHFVTEYQKALNKLVLDVRGDQVMSFSHKIKVLSKNDDFSDKVFNEPEMSQWLLRELSAAHFDSPDCALEKVNTLYLHSQADFEVLHTRLQKVCPNISTIHATSLTEEHAVAIGTHYKKLENVHIDSATVFAPHKIAESSTQLKELYIGGYHSRNNGLGKLFQVLSKHSLLKKLFIRANVGESLCPQDVEPLTHLKNLKELQLINYNFEDGAVKTLTKIPKLALLDLSGGKLECGDEALLQKMPKRCKVILENMYQS